MNVLFCGIAMALGWGLRGEFGGMTGAMIPGGLIGLAVALTSRRRDWLRKAPLFGAAGALGFALGGMMSYGRIIGYTKGIDMLNVTYGYAMLGVVGGLWGAFGAGIIGLVASPKKYRVWQVVAFVAVAVPIALFLHWLLVTAIGLRMTPPRGDSWPECIGACLTLLGMCWLKRDPVPPRLMFWGLVGGSFGFMIGESLQVYGSFLGPSYDWWKVMEQSFGFIMGAVVAYGVRRECADIEEAEPPPYGLIVFGLVVTAWFVPMITFHNALEHFRGTGLIVSGDGHVSILRHFEVRYAAILALMLLAAWKLRDRQRPALDPQLAAKWLFAWVAWSCVMIGVLKMSFPKWHWIGLWVHNGFLAMAVILTAWIIFGFASERGWKSAKPRLRVVAPVFVAAAVLIALLLGATSIATHRGQGRGDAHRRFGAQAELVND